MSVQLPPGAPLGALLLRGWTRRAGEAAPVLRDVLVVKGAYDVVAGEGGTHRAVPVADPARVEPAVGDTGSVVVQAGDEVGFDLVAEADTALEKARTDVVVEGRLAGATGGEVRIDGAVWLRRADTGDTTRDLGRHLFGRLPRSDAPRRSDATDFDPAASPLPATYSPAYNNMYRRGGAFSTPGDRNTAALPSAGLVEVFRTPDASDAPFTVRLPDLALRARLRAWCGHGPDEPPFWQLVDEVEPVPDTLVLAPDAGTASVVWRGGWRSDLVPVDRWRSIQVLPQGAAAPVPAGGGG